MKDVFRKAEMENRDAVSKDAWRLHYHLMPPAGWLNDPNGLCQFKGTYHIFYQYSPQNPYGGKKGWGHYSTRDFIHYTEEEPALYPDSEIDKDGAYSGSAFVKDGKIRFFYTGNIKEEGDHDYIYSGRGHYTNTFSSEDGQHFSEKKAMLKNEDYPAEMSCHVRDPKIYEKNGNYYMILGARDRNDTGCLLVYESNDLDTWKYLKRIDSDVPFGYMWECPDLFDLDGRMVLISCPQGVKTEGYRYENIYQNGYFLPSGSLEKDFTLHDFAELDNGFDFYAPQTFEDEKGRRILIGWMGMPDAVYTNPTIEKGWQHALTLPRQLHIKENRLYQYPIEEIQALRQEEVKLELKPDQPYTIGTDVFELHLFPKEKDFTILLRNALKITAADGLLTFSFLNGGSGRDTRHIENVTADSLEIFSDTSSVEIFVNHGQYAFTSRIYHHTLKDSVIVSSSGMEGTLWKLNSFEISSRN